MIKIMGVDFSGAGSDNAVGNTWLAEGTLNLNVLTIKSCCPISRVCLTNKLAGLSAPVVAAMDFPFSVPVEFARFWRGDDVVNTGWGMPDLWASAAEMKWDKFESLRRKLRLDEFKGEPKRDCDPPESYSPLHYAPPNMVPMTFRGMQMLHRLWSHSTINPVLVPPLPKPSRLGAEHRTKLLEVMPGATLRSFGLPFTEYKDTPGKRGQRKEMRRHILDELPQRANPLAVILPGDVYASCLNCDDALDSVVAAITAALWSIDWKRFVTPPEQGQPNYNRVLLEGWLYIPRRRCPECGRIL